MRDNLDYVILAIEPLTLLHYLDIKAANLQKNNQNVSPKELISLSLADIVSTLLFEKSGAMHMSPYNITNQTAVLKPRGVDDDAKSIGLMVQKANYSPIKLIEFVESISIDENQSDHFFAPPQIKQIIEKFGLHLDPDETTSGLDLTRGSKVFIDSQKSIEFSEPLSGHSICHKKGKLPFTFMKVTPLAIWAPQNSASQKTAELRSYQWQIARCLMPSFFDEYGIKSTTRYLRSPHELFDGQQHTKYQFLLKENLIYSLNDILRFITAETHSPAGNFRIVLVAELSA